MATRAASLAALAVALALAAPAFAAPCNDVRGCVVRARFCATEGPQTCHVERLLPEPGVGLCTMTMMQAAVGWIVGDEAKGRAPHPGFRLERAECVTPDDVDL